MKPYPIFLVGLENRHCVVVGGGEEAEFKVRGLLEVDAHLTVISRELTPQLKQWAFEESFCWVDRDYRPGDLKGAWLVISERFDPVTNQLIWDEAEGEKALVTVMDDIPRCNAVAGSVIRQGPLAITISTSGSAPALSVRLRQRFEQEFGEEYGTFLRWMKAMRRPMAERHPVFKERRKRWYELVDSDVLSLIRVGQVERARARIVEIVDIDSLPEPVYRS